MMQDRARLSGFAFVLLICQNLVSVNDYLASEMCVLKDFNCIFAEFGMCAKGTMSVTIK